MSRYHWSDTLESILGEGAEAEEDIQQLGRKLEDLAEEGGAMPLAEMDGFAAGLQVLPEVVPAREWLVHVWGPETALAEIEEAAELEAAVRAHYYGVARTLEEDLEQYRPLLGIDQRDEGVFWKPWVLGLARAIRMRPAAWVRIDSSNDLDVQEALLVIQRLYEATNGTSGCVPEGLDLLDEMAPILICGMVRELSAVWSSQDGAKRRMAEVSLSTAEGQVPCACGSGRPYRGCCGSH